MNRLATADGADADAPKTLIARRRIRAVAPDARVLAITEPLQSARAMDALRGVDVLFGCVDNDGARLVLNALALAYTIPYLDLASGIHAEDGVVETAGGRVAIVLPADSPCLDCMSEIDHQEARFFLSSSQDQDRDPALGYVRGMEEQAPAVVSLNGTVASVAVNEFAIYASGLRPVSLLLDLDLLGIGRTVKSQWLTPREVNQRPGCFECTARGLGDEAEVDRFVGAGGGNKSSFEFERAWVLETAEGHVKRR